jgi:hypothetical protein
VRRQVRIDKVKRPGGVFEFDMELVEADHDGIWLGYTTGANWRAPHDTGTMPFNSIVLLRPDDPFVTWWVDDPADRRVEVDICRPPIETPVGWSFIGLELDPVRHELTGAVEIEDDDEFQEACVRGWITAEEAALATATAQDLATALTRRIEPWGETGWRRLRELLARAV